MKSASIGMPGLFIHFLRLAFWPANSSETAIERNGTRKEHQGQSERPMLHPNSLDCTKNSNRRVKDATITRKKESNIPFDKLLVCEPERVPGPFRRQGIRQ